jgi:uncharacterized protein YpiB (UPF0302 family)
MTQKKKLAAKKEFIYWFLTNHYLKWPHVSKLLYYLYNNESLLNRTLFSRYLSNQGDTLLISATGSKTFPFICKLRGRFYNDVDQIIDELRCNPPETLLCRLSVPSTPACIFCTQPRWMKLDKKLKQRAKAGRSGSTQQNTAGRKSPGLLKAFDRTARILVLFNAIDTALDSRNKADFYLYSRELLELMEKKIKSDYN